MQPERERHLQGGDDLHVGVEQPGTILCYVDSDRNARLELTDDALNVYPAVVATDNGANHQQIYQSWRDRGTLMR